MVHTLEEAPPVNTGKRDHSVDHEGNNGLRGGLCDGDDESADNV